MRIVFSAHARGRMRERKIQEIFVHTALLQPDKVERDQTEHDRFVAKKIFTPAGSRVNYLLLVFYERTVAEIKVITVISTSKIDKYL